MMASRKGGCRRAGIAQSAMGTGSGISLTLATLCWLTAAAPASAQDAQVPAPDTPAETQGPPAPDQEDPATTTDQPEQTDEAADTGSETDILSRNTLYLLLDGRYVMANGNTSWVNGGLGKTRFQGNSEGDAKIRVVPVEAALIWTPRFTGSLSANVSGAWQRDQENDFDLIEAFVSFLPEQTGSVNFSARAGLMWPEISLEHSTGGAWSVVNTITPSAINSWVGEEVKLIGVEATLSANLGEHRLSATGAAFGFDDTSGTLLSFRGWALHDEKATAFGHFPLPPLNDFIVHLQEDQTRSLIEIDDRVGFYGRLDWRPPWPFGVSVFYYDNRGDPEAFTTVGQWGWRTRFLNVGLDAEVAPATKVIAQGMTGSTIMGFEQDGVRWVHTHFRSLFVLLTHEIGKGAITGRVETFETNERGSEMSRDESEDGWALTVAGRWAITDNLTALVEGLHVWSERGVRRNLGLPAEESQTVFQASLRFRL